MRLFRRERAAASPPEAIRLPRDVLRRASALYPDHPAIITPLGRRTYGVLHARVQRLAAALNRIGIGRGATIMTLLGDDIEQIELRLAALELSAAIAPLTAAHTSAEIIGAGRQIEPDLFVYDPQINTMPARFFNGNLPQTTLLKTGPGSGYDRLVDMGGDPEPDLAAGERDVALLHCSFDGESGAQVLYFTQEVLLDGMRLTRDALGITTDRYLVGMPLGSGGAELLLPVLAEGGTLVLPGSIQMGHILPLMEAEQVPRIFITTGQLLDFLDETRMESYDLSGLRQVIYGGEAVPPTRLEEAINRFGTGFHQVYRLGECQSFLACLALDRHVRKDNALPRRVLDAVGLPLPAVRIDILDGHNAPLPAGQVGEIAVSAPTLFNGYWGRPDLNARLRRQGYIRSGDLGFIDAEGLLHVVNRRRDVIEREKQPVFPRIVENVAHRHPAVRAAVLVHDRQAGRLSLCIALRRSFPGSGWGDISRELWSLLRHHLSPHQLPDQLVHLPEMPATESGRVCRRTLAERLARRDGGRLGASGVVRRPGEGSRGTGEPGKRGAGEPGSREA